GRLTGDRCKGCTLYINTVLLHQLTWRGSSPGQTNLATERLRFQLRRISKQSYAWIADSGRLVAIIVVGSHTYRIRRCCTQVGKAENYTLAFPNQRSDRKLMRLGCASF